MHEVAITGVGIVSSLGTGSQKVTESLHNGRSGIRVDPKRLELGFRSGLTGAIDDFNPPPLGRKERKALPDFGLQAYAAAREAIGMAGWGDAEVRHPSTGLIVGNDSSTIANAEQVETVKREQTTLPLGAHLIFRALNSTVTMNLTALMGIRGGAWTVSGACASGGHSIGQAAELIASGRRDHMLCGGVQEINWESVASFDSTNAFSTRQDDPAAASRPFDADRDGLVPSGGAAMLALERYDVARRRGAQILGRLLSFGFSSDGQGLAVPSGEGLGRAMAECISRAGIGVERVDYVSAHGTSTLVGDAAEAKAIAAIFKDSTPWVSATKSLTGHEMWMAGAAQVVYALLAGQAGFIPPTINFERQEEGACPLRIASTAIDERPGVVLCNSAGFGGTNACLLVGVGP